MPATATVIIERQPNTYTIACFPCGRETAMPGSVAIQDIPEFVRIIGWHADELGFACPECKPQFEAAPDAGGPSVERGRPVANGHGSGARVESSATLDAGRLQ